MLESPDRQIFVDFLFLKAKQGAFWYQISLSYKTDIWGWQPFCMRLTVQYPRVESLDVSDFIVNCVLMCTPLIVKKGEREETKKLTIRDERLS